MDNYNGLSIDVAKRIIRDKIEQIYQIVNDNGLSSQIYLQYQKEYLNILKCKKTKEKSIKLNNLFDKVQKTYEELKQIDIKLAQAFRKIEQANYGNIYSSMITSNDQKRFGYIKLAEIIQLTDTEKILKEITCLNQELNEIVNLTEKILEGQEKYAYDLDGIKIRINFVKKECFITFNNSLKNILEECKINKLKALLPSKLESISFNEIIEPKYIGNELELKKVIFYDEIPIKEVLKYDINTLLVYIGINKEINNKEKIEEISKNSEIIKKFITIIEAIERLNYKINQKEENIKYIEDIYNRINLNLLDKTYDEILPIIEEKYQNESFVCSSLQLVYNSLGNEIRERLHNELSSNKKQTDFVTNVIKLIQKYARNKYGEPYPVDEILNFLKQKNEIINTKYAYNDFEKNDEYSEVANIDQILFSLTSKRR